MTVKEVLAELEKLGNENVRVHNKKYGADDNQYGVKKGDIRKVAKKIKTNQTLGHELWATKNADAQQVALLIMKPKDLSAKELNEMVKTTSFAHVADWFNSYILKDHAERETLREKWMDAKNVWAARSGWSLTAGRVTRDSEGIDIKKLLDRIEKEMPQAAPEVQWTMNTTLVQIGINHPKHRKRAIAIGEKLGVYSDYPVSKGCTSPYAPIWINEMVSRQG